MAKNGTKRKFAKLVFGLTYPILLMDTFVTFSLLNATLKSTKTNKPKKSLSMNVKKFIELAQKNYGGSYNINSGEINPTTGFMVSLPFEETHNDLNLKSVKQFISKNAEHLSKPDHFFGLWFSEKWYYDVNRNVPTLADAIRLGMQNDQLAIYGCEAGEVIPLPKRQTAGTLAQQRAYIESVVRRMAEKEKAR